MKLTTKERKAVRELLILAKTRLWDGAYSQESALRLHGMHRHICNAIYAWTLSGVYSAGTRAAVDFVSDRLGDAAELEEWLVDTDPDGVSRSTRWLTRDQIWNHYTFNTPKLQATRHAWIDSMIAELT